MSWPAVIAELRLILRQEVQPRLLVVAISQRLPLVLHRGCALWQSYIRCHYICIAQCCTHNFTHSSQERMCWCCCSAVVM